MTEKYHELKLREAERAAAIKNVATIDYNVMMGKLDDPEQEVDDGTQQEL